MKEGEERIVMEKGWRRNKESFMIIRRWIYINKEEEGG